MLKVYDIGLYGLWSQCNYGSIISYFALNKYLTDNGSSVLMLELPAMGGQALFEHGYTHARRFANEHYAISHVYSPEDMWKYNNICSSFLLGSDQIWNYGVARNYGKSFYLDFVNDFKPKAAYAATFGHEIDFTPENEKDGIGRLFRRFDSISVREDDSVRLLSGYGVDASQVVDPIFLHPASVYEALADKAAFKPKGRYIAACILDPIPEAADCVRALSDKTGIKNIVATLDGNPRTFREKSEILGLPLRSDVQIEDLVNIILNSSYVITDSYHTMCLAIMFRRNFIVIPNRFRGYSRFDSFERLVPVGSRYCHYDAGAIRDGKYSTPPESDRIINALNDSINRSKKWIEDNI